MFYVRVVDSDRSGFSEDRFPYSNSRFTAHSHDGDIFLL